MLLMRCFGPALFRRHYYYRHAPHNTTLERQPPRQFDTSTYLFAMGALQVGTGIMNIFAAVALCRR